MTHMTKAGPQKGPALIVEASDFMIYNYLRDGGVASGMKSFVELLVS